MFGMGHGFHNVLLFSSRKSEMNLADPSFLGMMKVGIVLHLHFDCPPASSKWNIQSVLLLHGKAIHWWTHHKVVQEFGSLPVWQAGVNQQPSCSILPPGFTPE